jgi:exopolysaccharide biosynthesis protein
MKKILFILICIACSLNIYAVESQENDSITIVRTHWIQKTKAKGLVFCHASYANLFGVPQDVYMLEISPKYYRAEVLINKPYEKTSIGAKKANAVAAINGCFFNTEGTNSVCFLQKNGIICDTTSMDAKILVNGAMIIKRGKGSITDWNIQKEKKFKVRRASVLASGPRLIKNGKLCKINDIMPSLIKSKHPRSAIGYNKKGQLIFIVVDGRHPHIAEGMSIKELAYFLHLIGGQQILNLDGGGSSTLWLDDAPDNCVLNKPCDNKKFSSEGERHIANEIIIRPINPNR